MLGDVWWFFAAIQLIFPSSSPLKASVPSLHLHATCSSFVRKDRRCPDLDAGSRTGCWRSLGANSSPVRRHANLLNVQVQRDQMIWGMWLVFLPLCLLSGSPHTGLCAVRRILVSEWPRASSSSSHVGEMSGHTANSLGALGSACWWLSLVWLGAGASDVCFLVFLALVLLAGLGASGFLFPCMRATGPIVSAAASVIATGSSLKLRGTCVTCRTCGPTEPLTSATASGC